MVFWYLLVMFWRCPSETLEFFDLDLLWLSRCFLRLPPVFWVIEVISEVCDLSSWRFCMFWLAWVVYNLECCWSNLVCLVLLCF